jgi:hypothetical protein
LESDNSDDSVKSVINVEDIEIKEIIDMKLRFLSKCMDHYDSESIERLGRLESCITEIRTHNAGLSSSETIQKFKEETLRSFEEWRRTNPNGISDFLVYCGERTNLKGSIWDHLNNLLPEPEIEENHHDTGLTTGRSPAALVSESEDDEHRDVPPRRQQVQVREEIPTKGAQADPSPSRLMLTYKTLVKGRESTKTIPIVIPSAKEKNQVPRRFSFGEPRVQPKGQVQENKDELDKAKDYIGLLEQIKDLDLRREAMLIISKTLAEKIANQTKGYKNQVELECALPMKSSKKRIGIEEEEPSRSSKHSRILANIKFHFNGF